MASSRVEITYPPSFWKLMHKFGFLKAKDSFEHMNHWVICSLQWGHTVLSTFMCWRCCIWVRESQASVLSRESSGTEGFVGVKRSQHNTELHHQLTFQILCLHSLDKQPQVKPFVMAGGGLELLGISYSDTGVCGLYSVSCWQSGTGFL